MALTFLNGGAPNHIGYVFSTAIDLIDTIETTLVTAGWVTDTKVSGVSLFTRATSLVGGFPAFVEFIISGTSPNLILTIRGWQQQGRTTGSPAAIHTATFSVSGSNRLWITADQEAGCLSLFNSNGAMSGFHFGFLDRVDTGDQWAWMIGRIYSFGYLFGYSARSAFNGTNWKQLSTDFGNYSENPNAGSGALPVSTFDASTRGQFNDAIGITSTNGANPFYLAGDGKLNYNSRALITPDYCYHEGKDIPNRYGAANNTPLFFRGYVKYAACGAASIGAAEQVLDTVSGNRYLSVGASRWQAMRIL